MKKHTESKSDWSVNSHNVENTVAINNSNAEISDSLIRLQLLGIRKAKHLTQKQMSELSGLSESCISNMENPNGQSSPTVRSLIRYATALGIELYINVNPRNKDVQVLQQ